MSEEEDPNTAELEAELRQLGRHLADMHAERETGVEAILQELSSIMRELELAKARGSTPDVEALLTRLRAVAVAARRHFSQ
ncbi:MAG: hypothetical protein AAGD10_11110 [Myxococcota bacterium]